MISVLIEVNLTFSLLFNLFKLESVLSYNHQKKNDLYVYKL